MKLNTDFADDTYCDQEYASLCEEVQATLLCDPRAAVQSAVTSAWVLRRENWKAEGRKLLAEFGLLCPAPAPMRIVDRFNHND